MKNLFLLALLPFPLFAESLVFSWSDNSDNEDGFIFEALEAGEWVEVGRTAANVSEFELQESERFEGARVCAFNAWGRSGYAQNLKAEAPKDLKATRKTETEVSTTQTTKTTVTEYETKT